jgi:hypothetical protein
MFTTMDKLFIVAGKCAKTNSVISSVYMVHISTGEIDKL